MKTRHLAIGFAIAVLASLLGFTATASAGPAPKVDVCHVDDEGNYNLINVSDNAIDKHIAHGDATPGDEVPGTAGYEFQRSDVQQRRRNNCGGALP